MATKKMNVAKVFDGMTMDERRARFGVLLPGKLISKSFADLDATMKENIAAVLTGTGKPEDAVKLEDQPEMKKAERDGAKAAKKLATKVGLVKPEEAKESPEPTKTTTKPPKAAKKSGKAVSVRGKAIAKQKFSARRSPGNGDPIATFIAEKVGSVKELVALTRNALDAVTEAKLITDARSDKDANTIMACLDRPNPGLARMSLGLMLRRYYRLVIEGNVTKKSADRWLDSL